MIDILAPSEHRSNGGIWNGTTWMQLDVDRVDFTINNDIKVYPQPDEETSEQQYRSSTHQMIITGHITTDSALVGSGVFTKTKNLILAGREWYVDLRAGDMTSGDCGYPRIRWNDQTWNMLIQKVAIIDNAEIGDTVMNYQIGLILAHDEDV